MRIAYFTESLPPLTDGVARTFTRLAETLNAEGVEFLFISPSQPTEFEPWRGRVIKVPSVPFPLYTYYHVGLPFSPWLDSKLDRFRPDLIHVTAPTPLSLYGQNYAVRRGIPSVASYHTHFTDYMPYYGLKGWIDWGWKLLKWFHNRSRLSYAPAPGSAAELIRRGIAGVQIWPRGIDKKKFSPRFRNDSLRRKLGAGKEPLLLFVGRLVREKDIADLAEAARRLREKGYRFRLAFGGDGPFRRELQALLPQDYFPGFLQGRELAELYASADLFVFPSTTETFGNVVLEAFASGLPVVAVNQGGSADLVNHRVNGLLARPRDPADFAVQIQTLLDHPGERNRLGKGALATAGDYDWPRINRRLLAGYQALLDQKARSPHPASKKKSAGRRALAHSVHRRYGLGPA